MTNKSDLARRILERVRTDDTQPRWSVWYEDIDEPGKFTTKDSDVRLTEAQLDRLSGHVIVIRYPDENDI